MESKRVLNAIIKEKNKQIEELESVLKAVICKFINNQIELDIDDINKAAEGTLYKEKSFMKFAYVYKVYFKENFVIKKEQK